MFQLIHKGVADTETHYALLNRHAAAPFDHKRMSGDLYAGEWWECTEAVFDEFLNCLPPISFYGGFAISEFTTDDVTTCYFRINDAGMARYFAGSCRMTKGNPLRPERMREHIIANMPEPVHPETLWCESCGEAPQDVRSEHAGLCGDCYGASISQAVQEASGDHICGHPLYHGGKVFAVCCLPHGQEHDHGVIRY